MLQICAWFLNSKCMLGSSQVVIRYAVHSRQMTHARMLHKCCVCTVSLTKTKPTLTQYKASDTSCLYVPSLECPLCPICKGVCRQDPNEGKSAVALFEPSSSDKWLASLRKSVSRALADFSRAATRGLLKILRSGSFSPNQARPGDTSHPSFVLHQHCMPARMVAVLPGAPSVLCYLCT